MGAENIGIPGERRLNTWKEIAEHMGLKEHQAKQRFGHALRKLAARLGYGK